MKTRMKKRIVLFVMSIIVVSLVACSLKTPTTKEETETKEETVEKETSETVETETTSETSAAKEESEKDVITITFAVPYLEAIYGDHVLACNEALLEDGYPYQLKVKELGFSDYAMLLQDELENGTVDVAFLGFGDESNSVYNLISSGLVLNLDDILASDTGKALYEAFPEALWGAVKCNGHYYSIPNCTAEDLSVYAVFNRDYFSDAEIDSWDGTIDGIYKMIKDVEWDDEAAPRFQYLLSGDYFDSMIGCEMRNGLLYDYESGSIENPLESDKYLGFLHTLDQMRGDGFMADDISYSYNLTYISQEENLEEGNYLVALDWGEPEEYFLKDNLSIKTLPFSVPARINGSIGIANNTENPEAVVEFLGLLYGKDKYANILMFGKQDVDYEVVDGFAVSGNKYDPDFGMAYLTSMILDLFINVHPVKGDLFVENRKEAYFSYYENVTVSPFTGFIADTADYSAIAVDLDMFLESITELSWEEALDTSKEQLKKDGIEAYVAEVNAQWEAFSQT